MIITVILVRNNPSCLIFSLQFGWSFIRFLIKTNKSVKNNSCKILSTSNGYSFYARERNVGNSYVQFSVLIVEIFKNTFYKFKWVVNFMWTTSCQSYYHLKNNSITARKSNKRKKGLLI